MRIIRQATADEMVATFLRAEIASSRFSSCVEEALSAKGVDRRVVTDPDLSSARENWVRGELLAAARGYGRNERIFERFPSDVEWFRARIDATDYPRVRYVDYGYWNRLSGGTHRVLDGARNVRRGVMPYGVSNAPYFELADRIRQGHALTEPILVGEHPQSDLVILEGHLRMTSYLLHEDGTPEALEVLVGFSPDVCEWVGTCSPYIPQEDRVLAAIAPHAA